MVIEMRATDQYFLVVLFLMLYKVVTFYSATTRTMTTQTKVETFFQISQSDAELKTIK